MVFFGTPGIGNEDISQPLLAQTPWFYGNFVAGDEVGVRIQDTKLPSNSLLSGNFGNHPQICVDCKDLDCKRERDRERHTTPTHTHTHRQVASD